MEVYETHAWTGLSGHTMRPGGMALTARLLQLAALEKGVHVLDLGCGMGATVAHLTDLGYQAVGIDCSAELIRQGRTRCPQAELMVARGENLPFAGGTLDAVIAECSLSAMAQPAVLHECARGLKRGGKLMISDVYARAKTGTDGLAAVRLCDFRTRVEWEELLALCGFERLWWEDCSAVWKEFAAQVIWQYGSLSVLFDCRQENSIAACKPGYFLALARKA